MTERNAAERTSRRLDQWLWFARLAKTRSHAARLCAAALVAVNNAAVKKPNHPVRIGDVIVFPQRGFRRTVRVCALGHRRGPAIEAGGLYEETSPALRLTDRDAEWVPLLGDDEPE